MIGSNLLDNLDEKVIPVPSSTPADSAGNDLPVVENTITNKRAIPLSPTTPVTASPKDAMEDVAPSQGFGSLNKSSNSNDFNYQSTPNPSIKKTPFSPKGYGTNSYAEEPKKTREDTISMKASYTLPFNLDVPKLKSFALNFIVPIVSFSVSLLLIVTVIIPSFKNLPDLKNDLVQKQNLNNTLSKKLSNLERLIDFKRVVDENSTLINNVLVSEEMVPELLSQVDTIAKESSLEVSRLSYSLSQAGSGSLGYPSVDVSLGVIGTYDQLTTFLKLVESASRLIDVSTYRYSIGSKDANALNMNLVLRSPYLFVNSSAVTDDPIDLDVTSQGFLKFVSKIQGLKYYNPNELPVLEIIEQTEEATVDVNQEENIPSAN